MKNGEDFQAHFDEGVSNVLKRIAREKKDRVEIQKHLIQPLENLEVEAKEISEKERYERQVGQDNLLLVLDRIFSHIENQRGFNFNNRNELKQSLLYIKSHLN